MGFDLKKALKVVNPAGYIISAAGGKLGKKTYQSIAGKGGKKEDEVSADRIARNTARESETREQGQKTVSDLYGQDAAQRTGADVQDIIKRRRELMDRPSGRAEAIQASGSREVANIRESAGAAGSAIAGGKAAEQATREASREAQTGGW